MLSTDGDARQLPANCHTCASTSWQLKLVSWSRSERSRPNVMAAFSRRLFSGPWYSTTLFSHARSPRSSMQSRGVVTPLAPRQPQTEIEARLTTPRTYRNHQQRRLERSCLPSGIGKPHPATAPLQKRRRRQLDCSESLAKAAKELAHTFIFTFVLKPIFLLRGMHTSSRREYVLLELLMKATRNARIRIAP